MRRANDYYISAVLLIFIPFPAQATESERESTVSTEDYIFDPKLFRGGRFNSSVLSRLTQANAVAPGKYKVDIYVNGNFIESSTVLFEAQADSSVRPCLSRELLTKAGINMSETDATASCFPLDAAFKGATSRLDMAQLKLTISVPQSLLNSRPRGYVPPEALDTGSTLGFINYLSNYYHVSYSGSGQSNQDSAWFSFSGGLNIGAWQYRQLSNLSWNRGNSSRWDNIRRYIQRPLPAIQSQVAAGELITTGRFFSGLNYNGLSLSTDDRMLPDSMRGYAPTVRGLAKSNAKVSVYQNGNEIYQTTVAPGPFEINDLYPTSYSGDLDVKVTEADGSVSTFSVPFSAVPDSIRPGMSRLQLALGRTRDSGENALFGDITWQQGVNNAISLNSGLRLADGYQAVMLGSVYSNYFGALGFDLTWSQAKMPYGQDTRGWMAHLSYSKTFQPTNTSLTLASYQYSDSGYRDLSDVLGIREAARHNKGWRSSTWQQRSRVDLTLSQNLLDYGNIFISGSLQNYRDGRGQDKQLQLGYSKSFNNGVSMNLNVARQYTGEQSGSQGQKETITSVSFSIPLGGANTRAPSLSASWTHSASSNQFQTSASGMVDDAQTLSYSVSAMRDEEWRQNTFSGGLQKRLPNLNLGMNASTGNRYWQTSVNAQGALALHAGGVTFGPYLGDTFALVEAKGASGAKVFNSQHTVIDNNGFALIPAMTPYRYNRISLDPQGMDNSAELINSEQQVAPVSGAGVKVVFHTRKGVALLITATLPNNAEIPLGADVLDDKGAIVGMAGQRGQIYVRSEQTQGIFIVRWGSTADEQCRIHYNVTDRDVTQPLIALTSVCQSSLPATTGEE